MESGLVPLLCNISQGRKFRACSCRRGGTSNTLLNSIGQDSTLFVMERAFDGREVK